MTVQPPSIPSHGRLAGIDFGTARIGIAVCDSRRTLASPFETYRSRDLASDAAWFRSLVAEESLVGFVVGLPLRNSGEESRLSLAAREFGRWLEETTGKGVVFHDERFTTREAEQWLRRAGLSKARGRERVDKLAAQILLTSYLESSGDQAPRPLDG